MEGVLVGCVPLTWGQFKRQNSDEWPEERILREVAQAGFEGVSSGPRSGQSTQEVVDYYAGFGLKPAPGYLGGDFWKTEEIEKLVDQARQKAIFSREAGVMELFVAPSGGDYVSRANGQTRRQLAGHVGPDDGLTDDEYQRLGEGLNAVGQATLAQGVKTCIHNHVGQVIETRAEVDRLFSLVDRNVVFLGPDIGHITWAGDDAVQLCRDYADSIKSLHLKDIDPTVRQQGRDAQWDYGTFSAKGIFTELGEGCVDYPEIFRILSDAGYKGWILSEIDVTQKGTPLESATICRNYLRSLGV